MFIKPLRAEPTAALFSANTVQAETKENGGGIPVSNGSTTALKRKHDDEENKIQYVLPTLLTPNLNTTGVLLGVPVVQGKVVSRIGEGSLEVANLVGGGIAFLNWAVY